jgi:hypothetical protein
MKNDKIKIGNIEVEYTRSGVFKLFELYYKKECNEDRTKELKNNISKIESIEEKIKYCKDILKEYNQNIDPNAFAVSGMTMKLEIFPKETKIFFDKNIQIEIDSLEAELKNQRSIGKRKKYSNKEIALAYIFEVDATGQPILKSSQGEFAKNKIQSIGEKEYNVNGNSFYKEVRNIRNKYNINNEKDLNSISPRWYDVVKEISIKRNKWDTINEYLKTKGILKG